MREGFKLLGMGAGALGSGGIALKAGAAAATFLV